MLLEKDTGFVVMGKGLARTMLRLLIQILHYGIIEL
jgi:hypothetical protein